MKQAGTIFLMIVLSLVSMAQNDTESYEMQRHAMINQYRSSTGNMRERYDERRYKAEADYAAFRQKANEEYAAFMRKAWEQFDVQPAEPKPKEPEPPKPQPKPKPDVVPPTKPLPKPERVVAPPKVTPPPMPAVPQAPPETPTTQFTVYSTECHIHAQTNEVAFKLTSIDEKSCAEAWKTLSQANYDGLLHDCLEQRDQLHLGDWGYLNLLKSVSERFLGKGSNEAVLFQMYLFVQSGYKARIAKQADKLVLLVPFKHKIYSYSYTVIDGSRYYVLSKIRQGGISVCNVGFPKEQVADIVMSALPSLNKNPQPKRTFSARQFGTMQASVNVDKSLIDFMNDYPVSDAWDCYSLAGLSEQVKKDLYPALKNQIAGKSQRKAAMMLLDFVQTAFDYATDQDQFGYERPLFADESFYYPKNDCEDRSILFSILVRDLMGLEVVLLDWPGHIGTAVHFTEEVEGDYLTIDGKRYTVCDPTYIGAGPGMTMPQFKEVSAKVVML